MRLPPSMRREAKSTRSKLRGELTLRLRAHALAEGGRKNQNHKLNFIRGIAVTILMRPATKALESTARARARRSR
jgi:hypothetical protein